MDQYLVYYIAEYMNSQKNFKIEKSRGIISASSYQEASTWAEDFFGDDLISLYIFPLEEGPIELTEAQAKDLFGEDIL